ncbi:AKL18 protein [Puccinia sorghi]|uniref:AKL18 protein n=1 Tax=Puccinia sorghi TaxID=27349 RepID=A0A0L6VR75_9BASI|nr:AKL18 protein [Puccinia sorghi]
MKQLLKQENYMDIQNQHQLQLVNHLIPVKLFPQKSLATPNWNFPVQYPSTLPQEPLHELQVSKKETQGYFNKAHIPFFCLGACKGLVSEHKAFLAQFQENNVIDLILDYNAFYKHSLDKEECVGGEEENENKNEIIPKKSMPAISLESHGLLLSLCQPSSLLSSMHFKKKTCSAV